MFDSMLQFEFVHYFQFVQQYLEHFFQRFQNDYEMIYEIHIHVQFHEAKKKKRINLDFEFMQLKNL